MEIEIPKDVLGEVEKTSRELGLRKKELIARAVKMFIRNVKEEEDLKEEINAWERATIKDSKF